jgi:hypothetical protein
MSPEARGRAFDALATEMASGTLSRGKAIKLLGAALVGGTLGSLGFGGVAAADDLCKPNDKKCKKPAQCCSGNCSGGKCACQQEGGSCGNNSQCCSGNCQNNSCLPPTGPNLTGCLCQDTTFQTTCTSLACGQGEFFNPELLTRVCDRLCATHGGRTEFADCRQPEPGTCPG